MPDILLSGRISGNLPDIERWPDMRPDIGYPALEIPSFEGEAIINTETTINV